MTEPQPEAIIPLQAPQVVQPYQPPKRKWYKMSPETKGKMRAIKAVLGGILSYFVIRITVPLTEDIMLSTMSMQWKLLALQMLPMIAMAISTMIIYIFGNNEQTQTPRQQVGGYVQQGSQYLQGGIQQGAQIGTGIVQQGTTQLTQAIPVPVQAPIPAPTPTTTPTTVVPKIEPTP